MEINIKHVSRGINEKILVFTLSTRPNRFVNRGAGKSLVANWYHAPIGQLHCETVFQAYDRSNVIVDTSDAPEHRKSDNNVIAVGTVNGVRGAWYLLRSQGAMKPPYMR